MRHKAVLASSVAAALATGGVLAVTGGAQTSGEKTLKYVTKNCQFKLVDAPPKARRRNAAPGAGDQFALSCPIYEGTGARIGELQARCTITKGGKRMRGMCDGVYGLPDGELFLLARLDNTDTTSGAVAGGTKAYVGARGTFTSVDRPGEKGGDPSDDTFTLLP